MKMQVLLQQPREASIAFCNEHQSKRQMQNAKLPKRAAKTVKLKQWKINDAIPVKSKEITGTVLKSHEVSLPSPFFSIIFHYFSFPLGPDCHELTADIQLAINTQKPYSCGGIPKHLYISCAARISIRSLGIFKVNFQEIWPSFLEFQRPTSAEMPAP